MSIKLTGESSMKLIKNGLYYSVPNDQMLWLDEDGDLVIKDSFNSIDNLLETFKVIFSADFGDTEQFMKENDIVYIGAI